MTSIAEKLKKLPQTPYQQIAEKFETTPLYVGMIARGERNPTKGKGLKIKNYLTELLFIKNSGASTVHQATFINQL